MNIHENMLKNEKKLSEFACKTSDAIRFKEYTEDDIRPAFFRDIDKIIYSLSYTRYTDKTQVFSHIDNDNISRRMTHVQMVSKIARTIGRALNLNEDLIEAAALGHDLGHVPFGHTGERILSKISEECGEGYFNHNIQSARLLMNVENNGKGTNITLQVLDAIMCHNGEMVQDRYEPVKKTKEEFLQQYNNSYVDKNANSKMRPMTLEGCVVRISDVVGYIGKDIEDAITLGVIKIEDVPKDIVNVLGKTNSEIINTVVLDIINNSSDKPYITMSKEVFDAIIKLKAFNYENIYAKANTPEELKTYEMQFRKVFNDYLKDVKENNLDSRIFTIFLNNMCDDYMESTSDERKVIDYIAGMTDDYFVREYNRLIDKKWEIL